jgi:hypothetical protein
MSLKQVELVEFLSYNLSGRLTYSLKERIYGTWTPFKTNYVEF